MQQAQAEQIIALELFTKTINSCETLINKVSDKNNIDWQVVENLKTVSAAKKLIKFIG